MTIYRTPEGRRAVHGAANERLEAWARPHARATHPTELGPTHVLVAGNGPPLVLLAGTNFCAATWLPLIESLAASWQVHAVDLPGQPGLSHHERPRSPRAYGRWLAHLLPSLTRELPAVVGHSLGAHVALSAVADGAHVRCLGLLDPAGLMWLSLTPTVLRPTFPWLRRADERTSAALLAMMMATGASIDSSATGWMTLVGQHVRTSLAPSPLHRRDLPRVRTVRVVIASGSEDAFVPAARLRRAAARRLPDASLHLVDGAGHLLPHERPEAVARLLRPCEPQDPHLQEVNP